MSQWTTEGFERRATVLRAAQCAAVLLALGLSAPAFAAQDTKSTAAHHSTAAHPAAPQKIASAAKAAPAKSTAAKPAQPVASSKHPQLKTSKVAYVQRSYGISCVPYARSVTGMDIKGNAKDWWSNAAGLYARGSLPEPGSVMSFRSTGGMRLGHVAVVTRIIDSRTVEIDHANWSGPGATKGNIFKSIPVIDVSERNDWSRVRVGLGHSGDFGGTVYPTNGFIYDRPDNGSMIVRTAYTIPASTAPAYGRTMTTASMDRWHDQDVIHREVR